MSASSSEPVSATEVDLAESEVNDNQFVTFEVANEMFAVPMAPVQEIIRVPDVAALPLAPAALDGLANLRGRVLPIINLRRLFGVEERERDDATRALVINIGQSLGFVVDRVASVVAVDASEVEPADVIQSIVETAYLTGVIKRQDGDGQSRMLMLLDFEQLVRGQFSNLRKLDSSSAGMAESVSTTQSDEEIESDDLRLVSFTVADQEYAIDIADVQEIVQLPDQISAIPNAPAHVCGIINLRQRILPLVSLRMLFSLPTVALEEHHRIVVVALPGGAQVGLVTDGVKEVLSVPKDQADSMPGLLAQDQRMQEFTSICRLDEGKRLVSIIATDRLLGMEGIKDALKVAADNTDQHATENAMQQDNEELENDDQTQVVVFRLGREEFGVPIMSVQEIVRVPDVLARVPRAPDFVEGVINLRGSVLPVVDQRRRLGMSSIERSEGQRIMVYAFDGVRTGFIVDSVAEVLRIPDAQIEAAPDLSEDQRRLITRIAKVADGKRMVMLIEPRQLLGRQEMQAVGALADGGSVAEQSGVALSKAA